MADTTTTTTTEPAYHELYPAQYDALAGLNRYTHTYEGDYPKLLGLFAEINVGLVDAEFDDALPVAGATLTRLPGNVGHLVITVNEVTQVDWWGLDHVEVTKNVRTWMAGQKDAPDLKLLARWEALKSSNATEYTQYIYDVAAGTKLTGNTLLLAQKILEKGITSYTIHAPVITRKSVNDIYPTDAGLYLDRVGAPAETADWTPAGYKDGVEIMLNKMTSRAAQWLKIADRVTPNPDGTFTRIEQWLGGDIFDSDLYAPISSSATTGAAS